ncbi:hypothetical protein PRIPAC_87238 [Pristionchus pacificus]|uniref:Uncharacterized protein n=1 Tax=Pristionchus pacificus TaxID=54126 RepID=A0A2A6CVM6_PRIPA|nr:hypothetical protein PRIPAC_87238 [Pristionchus pacificus]|eukprot:PDM82282.1 hypothetical protein PRIPAC_36675 [Pristionchus pacificus]
MNLLLLSLALLGLFTVAQGFAVRRGVEKREETQMCFCVAKNKCEFCVGGGCKEVKKCPPGTQFGETPKKREIVKREETQMCFCVAKNKCEFCVGGGCKEVKKCPPGTQFGETPKKREIGMGDDEIVAMPCE